MAVVLRLGAIGYSKAKWTELSKLATIIECTSKDRAEFFTDLASKYKDVTHISRTFDSINQTGRFDAELVSHLPKGVLSVSHCGAGYDQIDVAPLTERKIQLSNVTGPVEGPTADTAVYLTLSCLRKYQDGHQFLIDGKWATTGGLGSPIGRCPEGKTVGILGMGGIGRAIRDRLVPFGFKKIVYYNRSRLSKELEAGSEYVTLDELISDSDIIMISVPLNANTRHSINKEVIQKMKDGVIIVNTARGAVINEKELTDALISGKVGSFGSDVFEFEPKVDPRLYELPNVISLPHMGTYTLEARKNMEDWTVQNVIDSVLTGKVKTIVPEQYGLFD